MTAYIYLHGFASSPQSSKAQYLRDRFAAQNLQLKVLDLNQEGFTSLTLTRQIKQTIAAFPDSNIPVTLIGSSFGALTSAWVAQQQHQVNNLVL
ncbi:MAG: YqiA/YcfP family alpha/beta fold hydrolase, partial [Cyanobacteria bacterium P01_E01_bin.35]